MNCLLFKYCWRYDLDWDQLEWTEYPFNSCVLIVLIEILVQESCVVRSSYYWVAGVLKTLKRNRKRKTHRLRTKTPRHGQSGEKLVEELIFRGHLVKNMVPHASDNRCLGDRSHKYVTYMCFFSVASKCRVYLRFSALEIIGHQWQNQPVQN